MNPELVTFGKMFKAGFDFMATDISIFGVSVSPLDIALTNVIIVMLFDIVLIYAGYDRTE